MATGLLRLVHLGDAAASPVPGVTVSSAAILNQNMIDWLKRFRAVVPSYIPIKVNSGYRDANAQARAMLTKLRMGDDLKALYGDKVLALLALPADQATWAAKLKEMQDRGVYMSRHMRADALDLHIASLPPDQVQILKKAAEGLGVHVILESIPVHMHVDRIDQALGRPFSPPSAIPSAASSSSSSHGVALLALAAVGIVWAAPVLLPALGLSLPSVPASAGGILKLLR